jgi:Methyltransferase small domain
MKVLPHLSDWLFACRVYRRFSSRPGASHIATRRALACLAAVLRQKRPRAVLEFGCGIGTITYAVLAADPDLDVVGIEANPFCLDQLERNIPAEFKPRLTVTRRDDHRIDRHFDLIIIDGKFASEPPAFLLPDTICFIEGDREAQAKDLQDMAAVKGLSIDLNRQFAWMPAKTCRIGTVCLAKDKACIP